MGAREVMDTSKIKLVNTDMFKDCTNITTFDFTLFPLNNKNMTDQKTIDEKLEYIWHNSIGVDNFIRDIKAVFELKIPTDEEIQIIYNKRGILHAIEYFLSPEYQTSPSLAEPKREIKVGDVVRLERFEGLDATGFRYMPWRDEFIGNESVVESIKSDGLHCTVLGYSWPLSAVTLVQPSQTKQEKMEEVNTRPSFNDELRNLINRYSKENGSDTPDYILADYLEKTLDVFNDALSKRSEWYGHVTPSPATELQSLLKDPKDLARAIEIFKQLEK